MLGNTRWLIVFDNVDQYSPLPDYNTCGYDIREFFPATDHGSIIITSRVQGVIEVGKSFPIGKLTQKDATRLLLQSSGFSGQNITQAEVEQGTITLVNQLDGLSLAIVLAGAFMRETGTSVKEYLRFYQSAWSKLQSQAAPTRQYQQGNILETWMITYQEIKKRDRTAATLLLLLACFDNQDIWYELIALDWPVDKIVNWGAFLGLGNLYSDQGKLKEAEEMYQQALAGKEKALGPKHTSTLDTVNNLGTLYSAQGKLKEAEEMYQRALAGKEKALGPSHPKTRMASKSLAALTSFVAERPCKRHTLFKILRRK
ncbi:Tetratricopeptide repeat-domain-containing protein [Aspergillus carlsbadensis]|nr:Tetratricopeptide repeat-domain-containing protein [Aspergillus carlsbadensis]